MEDLKAIIAIKIYNIKIVYTRIKEFHPHSC